MPRTVDATSYTRKHEGKRYRTVAVAFTFRVPALPASVYLRGMRLSTLAQAAFLVGVVIVNVVLLV